MVTVIIVASRLSRQFEPDIQQGHVAVVAAFLPANLIAAVRVEVQVSAERVEKRRWNWHGFFSRNDEME